MSAADPLKLSSNGLLPPESVIGIDPAGALSAAGVDEVPRLILIFPSWQFAIRADWVRRATGRAPSEYFGEAIAERTIAFVFCFPDEEALFVQGERLAHGGVDPRPLFESLMPERIKPRSILHLHHLDTRQ